MSWLLKHPGALLVGSLLLLALGGLGLVGWWTLRPRPVQVGDELPPDFPAEGFDHASFAALLARFVDAEGRVDYAGWRADPAARRALRRYLAALGRYGPRSAPSRFPSRDHELAYLLNAYNACVIEGVLAHWPLQSVQDLRAPLDVVAGLGFFARLRFEVDGEWTSLYALENARVRGGYADPRIHFVLNCASGGCPRLRPELPTGERLERVLAAAAAEFVADEEQVRVERSSRRVVVSPIFQWYRADFVAELARRGRPPAERSLIHYLLTLAGPELRAELEHALAEGYSLHSEPYDWGLNAQDEDVPSGPGSR